MAGCLALVYILAAITPGLVFPALGWANPAFKSPFLALATGLWAAAFTAWQMSRSEAPLGAALLGSLGLAAVYLTKLAILH